MRTPHETTTTTTSPARDGPAQQAGRFGLHVLEMCVVMCVTLALVVLLVLAVTTVFDLANPVTNAPVLSVVVVTVALASAMTAWMRYRSMAWRPTLEMAGSTVVSGALMVAGYTAGLVPASSELVTGTCGLACLTMIGVMLLRFRLYASHGGQHAHAAA